MKKVILFLLASMVFYIISIFALPSVSSYVWEKVGLTGFNNAVIQIRDEFQEFITQFDVIGKYKETKDSALEIKQSVESQVWETKQKIETIQTNVEKTSQAIDETTQAINNTMNSLNELGNSIGDIVPSTSSGNTLSWTSN